MNIFIILFILLINVINIFAIYKLLGKDIKNKEKIIFIAVGVAIMYILVSVVYWLSSIGMDKNAADAGRDFITFTFVPVNGLCVLTFLSSSYKKFKEGRLKANILRNRCLVLVAVLIILLVIEFFYFKNIQNNALEILNDAKNNITNNTNTINNSTNENDTLNNNINYSNENSIMDNNTNNENKNSILDNNTNVTNNFTNNINNITNNLNNTITNNINVN